MNDIRDDCKVRKRTAIPFGAEFSFKKKPISSEAKSCLHRFGKKMLPVIFVCYGLSFGGGWTGDLIIMAEFDDIEDYVASEVHVERLNSKKSWNQDIARSIRISLQRHKKVTHNVKLCATREP